MTSSSPGRQDAAGAADDVELRRVGPGSAMASDSAFAVALLTLWHAVAQAGGHVGFPADVERSTIGGAVAPVLDAVKAGRAHAVALARKRQVMGFALLERGALDRSHTGELALVMVEPDSQRLGLGSRLVHELLAVAGEVGIERVRVSVPADAGLAPFFGRFGLVECGRLPGWVRRDGGPDDDEVMLAGPVTG